MIHGDLLVDFGELSLSCWLFDGLIGWLAAWLINWLMGSLVDWLWLANWLIDCINRSIDSILSINHFIFISWHKNRKGLLYIFDLAIFAPSHFLCKLPSKQFQTSIQDLEQVKPWIKSSYVHLGCVERYPLISGGNDSPNTFLGEADSWRCWYGIQVGCVIIIVYQIHAYIYIYSYWDISIYLHTYIHTNIYNIYIYYVCITCLDCKHIYNFYIYIYLHIYTYVCIFCNYFQNLFALIVAYPSLDDVVVFVMICYWFIVLVFVVVLLVGNC